MFSISLIFSQKPKKKKTKDRLPRRTDSDSDLCINGDEDYNSRGGGEHRNSIGRVSIRLVSDDRNIFLASYKNRD